MRPGYVLTVPGLVQSGTTEMACFDFHNVSEDVSVRLKLKGVDNKVYHRQTEVFLQGERLPPFPELLHPMEQKTHPSLHPHAHWESRPPFHPTPMSNGSEDRPSTPPPCPMGVKIALPPHPRVQWESRPPFHPTPMSIGSEDRPSTPPPCPMGLKTALPPHPHVQWESRPPTLLQTNTR